MIITKQMPNEQLLPFVIEQLEAVEGKTVTLPLRGRSMRPFLEDGRDKALLIAAKQVAVGDAVLAEISPRHYVLHRVIGIDHDKVTLRGDGNLSNEYCRLADVKATALGFYRKGRTTLDSTNGLKWRTYSWLWMRLSPLRRYLLFALHPHIPARFKPHKQQQ
jgi:hypothetical protein